jgi:hypothetical protein
VPIRLGSARIVITTHAHETERCSLLFGLMSIPKKAKQTWISEAGPVAEILTADDHYPD